jgi:hypothetical protein
MVGVVLTRPDVSQQFFRAGRAEQWPQALTKQQIAEICSVHAPIMQRFGYLLADRGRAVPSARRNSTGPLNSVIERGDAATPHDTG